MSGQGWVEIFISFLLEWKGEFKLKCSLFRFMFYACNRFDLGFLVAKCSKLLLLSYNVNRIILLYYT